MFFFLFMPSCSYRNRFELGDRLKVGVVFFVRIISKLEQAVCFSCLKSGNTLCSFQLTTSCTSKGLAQWFLERTLHSEIPSTENSPKAITRWPRVPPAILLFCINETLNGFQREPRAVPLARLSVIRPCRIKSMCVAMSSPFTMNTHQ